MVTVDLVNIVHHFKGFNPQGKTFDEIKQIFEDSPDFADYRRSCDRSSFNDKIKIYKMRSTLIVRNDLIIPKLIARDLTYATRYEDDKIIDGVIDLLGEPGSIMDSPNSPRVKFRYDYINYSENYPFDESYYITVFKKSYRYQTKKNNIFLD
ncbi:hypothetical protein ACFL1H_01985 [Nanoarchaeota archaeon]